MSQPDEHEMQMNERFAFYTRRWLTAPKPLPPQHCQKCGALKVPGPCERCAALDRLGGYA